jgi:hypothetical protein
MGDPWVTVLRVTATEQPGNPDEDLPQRRCDAKEFLRGLCVSP